MKCDACKKEQPWLEVVGSEFVCHKCISKSKLMGLILRTHTDTFRYIVKTLKVPNYEALLKLTRQDVEKITDLKKYGIQLKTTNFVKLG